MRLKVGAAAPIVSVRKSLCKGPERVGRRFSQYDRPRARRDLNAREKSRNKGFLEAEGYLHRDQVWANLNNGHSIRQVRYRYGCGGSGNCHHHEDS